MKKTLVALAVVGLMSSISAKAGSADVNSAKAPAKKKVAHVVREHIYITSVPCTGSHLPLVVTRYGTDVHTNSSFIAYGQPQLDQTGQLNVAGELLQRDPAISSAGLRTR